MNGSKWIDINFLSYPTAVTRFEIFHHIILTSVTYKQ